MNREEIVKLVMVLGFLLLFLTGSRFHAEENKVKCTKETCSQSQEDHANGRVHSHEGSQLNYHERYSVQKEDHFAVATLKSCANFWEANATGMTFAIIIGGAALSLLLTWKKFEKALAFKGMKGAALGSVFGMPLNMCANCSAVTSVSVTAQNGSAESTLGIILGGALLNFIGIVTMFGLFSPAVVISRIVFSIIMILFIVPLVAKMVKKDDNEAPQNPVLNMISCFTPTMPLGKTIVKAVEDWLIAVGNIAYKLIPLMLLGTLLTAIFRVIFPNEFLHEITTYTPFIIIVIVAFIGTLLSVPVLFEILLGTILLSLGFGNGAIAAMVFAAPSFGIFTLVLTRKKLGGLKVPLLLILITFLFAIGAGLLADFLTPLFS
jgi:uncharacterized membrane protein YraQ (UPF0718 family)